MNPEPVFLPFSDSAILVAIFLTISIPVALGLAVRIDGFAAARSRHRGLSRAAPRHELSGLRSLSLATPAACIGNRRCPFNSAIGRWSRLSSPSSPLVRLDGGLLLLGNRRNLSGHPHAQPPGQLPRHSRDQFLRRAWRNRGRRHLSPDRAPLSSNARFGLAHPRLVAALPCCDALVDHLTGVNYGFLLHKPRRRLHPRLPFQRRAGFTSWNWKACPALLRRSLYAPFRLAMAAKRTAAP